MLGMPSGMVVDTNDTYALMNPYYAWFAQDTWRVNRNLTLTLGLRMEYERGATERYNRAHRLLRSQPRAADLRGRPGGLRAQSASRNCRPANSIVRGGSVYAGSNGAPREFWRNELMWLPRFSAAWQLDPKTIVRGGYGIYFDTLNVMNSAVDQFGFSRATNTQLTNDFGITWLAGDPQERHFAADRSLPGARRRHAASTCRSATRSAPWLASARVSRSVSFDRQHPRVQRWRVGVQRELGANMMVEASYWGQWGDRLFVTTRLDALPGQYWATGNTRNNAIATELNRR